MSEIYEETRKLLIKNARHGCNPATWTLLLYPDAIPRLCDIIPERADYILSFLANDPSLSKSDIAKVGELKLTALDLAMPAAELCQDMKLGWSYKRRGWCAEANEDGTEAFHINTNEMVLELVKKYAEYEPTKNLTKRGLIAASKMGLFFCMIATRHGEEKDARIKY
jgi:hypothetical protein